MKFNLKKYAFYITAFLPLSWVSCSETNQYFDPPTGIVPPEDEEEDPEDNTDQLPDEEALAFPGAEGFGRYTTGGRGGKE